MKRCEADIERIRRMEALYDELVLCARRGAMDHAAWEKVRELEAYYTSGQWLDDYERDERGEWPPDLKRGVLAQDAVYDLLDVLKDDASALNE